MLCKEKIGSFGDQQRPIKERHLENIKNKERVRLIEHPHRRYVHLMFKAPFAPYESEFSLRLRLHLLGQLEEYKERQAEKLEEYITRVKEGDKDEENPQPFLQVPSKLVEFDISSIKSLGLACADDPYYETSGSKWHPEAVFYNEEGEATGKLDHMSGEIGTYVKNCRDQKLKVNDDRKIVIRTSQLKGVHMVCLFIRGLSHEDHDRALYRLLNEETNQTLDESLMREALKVRPQKVRLDEGEGEEEEDEE